MPRYKLFLLERPSGDARAVQRAAWGLPSALDVPKLTKALKGDIEVDWLEIASSDRKRDIVKIQSALGAQGCMLALDDAGSSLGRDLTDAISQALSREGRRASRERARAATIWERGDGLRAVPVALARHARSIASVVAALAVLGGSVVLLAVWLGGSRGGGARPDASTLDRLAALSRGDLDLPAIPDTADGGGGGEVAEPAGRGSLEPKPSTDAAGTRRAIPDVPSSGAAAASAAVPPKPSAPPGDDTRTLEIAGFGVGIGWAALVELLARRGTRKSGKRSRAVLFRLVPATVVGAVTVAALIALERRPPPPPRPTPKAAPATRESAAPPHARSRTRPALQRARAAAAPKPARAASFRELVASLAPAPDPCASAGGKLATFLCVERLHRPQAVADGETESQGGGETSAARPVASTARATAEPGSPSATGTDTGAAPAGKSGATKITDERGAPKPAETPSKAAVSQPPATPRPTSPATVTPTSSAAPPPATPAPPRMTSAAHEASPSKSLATSTAPSPSPAPGSALTPSAGSTGAPRASEATTAAPSSPAAATTAPNPPAARPEVARRRNVVAALPTFLLGLLAGTVGLAIVAAGVGDRNQGSNGRGTSAKAAS